jgi:hypothetical protein
MSKEAALAFIKKAMEDDDLQKKLLAFAAQEGYEFTVNELTEEEMDEASGGLLISQPRVIAYPKVELTSPELKNTLLP